MKRLTYERDLDGFTDIGLRDGITVGDAICRLAEYEDTGLEPEEILSGKELAEVACALISLKEYKSLGTIDHIRDLLKAEQDGRMVAQKAVPGSQVWIMERDECGDPYDISGYMFFASIGNAVIVSPYLSGIKDLEETLDYYIEITAEEYSSDLAVFPNEDCYLTREEAEAALRKRENCE